MGEITNCSFWKCPNCGEVLNKGGLGTIFSVGQPTDGIFGSGTCGKCAASFAQADIYGGKYDFVYSRVAETLPADNVPARINLVIFRQGAKPPTDPERYCQKVVHDKYGESGPSVQGWRMVGNPDAPSSSDAVARYAMLSENGQLPDFGRPIDEFAGTGPDGNEIAVLFFSHASRSVGAEQLGFTHKKWWQFWK